MNALRKILSLINLSLKNERWLTQMLISGSIFGIGDASCQVMVSKKNNSIKEFGNMKFNWSRFLKMFSIGFLVEGPLAKFWYMRAQPLYIKKLFSKFPKYFNQTTKWKNAISSTVIDFFLRDWIYMYLVLLFGEVWEKKNFKKACEKV